MRNEIQVGHASLKWETVMSYAETRKTRSLVGKPKTIDELKSLYRYAKDNDLSICFRGGGNTFGDVILNHDHIILNTQKMDKVLSWNPENGIMVVGAGTTIKDVFEKCYIDKWSLAAIPGSLDVTIVGAVSNNIHGKDSCHSGNFGDQVVSLKILTANENILELSREINPEIFRAIVGGMGLIGAIVEVTLQLKRIRTPYVESFMKPVNNIEECIEVLDESIKENDFVVSWVDPFLKGDKMGRGFIACARWIDEDKPINMKGLRKSLINRTRLFNILPAGLAWFLFRPLFYHNTVKYLNIINYWLLRLICKLGLDRKTQLFTDYNFIVRKAPKFKQVYRPYGFLELQPMVSARFGVKAVKDLLMLGQKCGFESTLCVIKKHSGDDYIFSYSGDSYSIGWSTHLKGRTRDEIIKFNNKLLEMQSKYNGKTFLAKDELLTPKYFASMYPAYKDFLRIKNDLDSGELFSSNYYRKTIKPLMKDF